MAFTLTTWTFKTLPRSVFPYDYVPMTRMDIKNPEQVVMDLSPLSDSVPRPEHIIRRHDAAILSGHVECSVKVHTPPLTRVL